MVERNALKLFLVFVIVLFFVKGGRDCFGQGKTSLANMCKDGYYDECSRAPNCGGWSLADVEALAQPDPNYCMDGQGNSQKRGCLGYYPLCCYEIAATGDPNMCVGYWERLWCHPDQCKSISPSEKKWKNCAHASTYWCGLEPLFLPPVPLETRLGLPAATPTTKQIEPTIPKAKPSQKPTYQPTKPVIIPPSVKPTKQVSLPTIKKEPPTFSTFGTKNVTQNQYEMVDQNKSDTFIWPHITLPAVNIRPAVNTLSRGLDIFLLIYRQITYYDGLLEHKINTTLDSVNPL
ncbi:MAG: hypothetical protein WC489_05845 [Patescibacteria group bacterium]